MPKIVGIEAPAEQCIMDKFEPTSLDQADVDPVKVDEVYKGFARVMAHYVRHKRYDGGWTETLRRELFDSGDAVVVLPYDPVADRVVLVEQFRISSFARGIKPWLVECIAGRVNADEKPEQVAVREALEEADCRIDNLVKIGEMFNSPGIFAEYATMFCARTDASDVSGIHGLGTENEDIRALSVSFDDAMAALDDGRIRAAPAFVCLNWLARHRSRLKDAWSSA